VSQNLIGDQKQTCCVDSCLFKLISQLLKDLLYLKQTITGSRHRRATGQQQPLIIRKKQIVAGPGGFSALITDAVSPAFADGLSSVQLHTRQVQQSAPAC